MSLKNRRMVYEKLKKAGRLDRDDGALLKEFGSSARDELKIIEDNKGVLQSDDDLDSHDDDVGVSSLLETMKKNKKGGK